MNIHDAERLTEKDGYMESFLFMFSNGEIVKRFYNDLGEPIPTLKSKLFNPESFYRDQLAYQLNGRTEVKTPVGLIDVLTETEIIEVKTLSNWKGALGQVLAYGVFYPMHSKRIHLYSRSKPDISEIESVCSKFNVSVSFISAKKSEQLNSELKPLSRQELTGFMELIINRFKATKSEGAQDFYLNLFNKVADFYMDNLNEEELTKFNSYLAWLALNPNVPFLAANV